MPGDHRVRGTAMGRPDLKSVGTLEAILAENEWLVGGDFSVADVAVGSYLKQACACQPGYFGWNSECRVCAACA